MNMQFINQPPWAEVDKNGAMTKFDTEAARSIAANPSLPTTMHHFAIFMLAAHERGRLAGLNAAADKAFDTRNQFNARSRSWDDQKSAAVCDNLGKEIQKLRAAK